MWKKATPDASKTDSEKKPQHDGFRDTFESIVFAFLLALMFRTFEAEAFVIPTGSMAPTLYGRHKETNCRECGEALVVGASTELDREAGLLASRVTAALCPNCGAVNEQIFDTLPFNGDRILVNKYPYEFSDPTRWDVFVFKWPIDPQTNYIKRLVGLPGETIRIRGGNVYLWDGAQEEILRKAPDKQRRLQMTVHDNAHVSDRLLSVGWPERWAAVEQLTNDTQGIAGWQDTTDSGWTFDAKNRTFTADTPAGGLQWIRYRHFLPSVNDWDAIDASLPVEPAPRLVTDFCGYNAFTVDNSNNGESQSARHIDTGPFWVGDLTLNSEVNITRADAGSELLLELCEGTSWYRCRVDLSTGSARLEEVNSQLNERVKQLAAAETSLKGPGRYRLSFANVDDRLCLWINDSLVSFGDGALITAHGATDNTLPTRRDLTPAGIALQGAAGTVSQLTLERDIYYRGTDNYGDDYFYAGLIRQAHDPDAWGEAFQKVAKGHDTLELVIPEDHFLALGYNSPASSDSRMWPGQKTVPREYLVGKAFFIYWPHGVPFMNGGQGFAISKHRDTGGNPTDYAKYAVPFYPQIQRMHRIR